VFVVLDHINLRVADYARSKQFYQAALAPLGYKLAMEVDSGAGFSKGYIPSFWIKAGVPPASGPLAPPVPFEGCGGPYLHVAFSSDTRAAVDAFHRAALAAGGRDNGGPRLRTEYHANYYGAFILDPDGYNIEAVCHKPE
jgi:catechol 2,3-dioxygenase-like lactoylglutathione lyase family enzyme